MAARYRDHSVDRSAVKALVAVYGPREAARQANLPVGTVLSWCRRYQWKKAMFIPRATGINGDKPPKNDAAMALAEAIENHREQSTLHLAKYTEKAAKQASELSNPLDAARKVRDVAGVHAVLWPKGEENELIESGILIGSAKVVDNPQEILANVREVLPDQRPAGD